MNGRMVVTMERVQDETLGGLSLATNHVYDRFSLVSDAACVLRAEYRAFKVAATPWHLNLNEIKQAFLDLIVVNKIVEFRDAASHLFWWGPTIYRANRRWRWQSVKHAIPPSLVIVQYLGHEAVDYLTLIRSRSQKAATIVQIDTQLAEVHEILGQSQQHMVVQAPQVTVIRELLGVEDDAAPVNALSQTPPLNPLPHWLLQAAEAFLGRPISDADHRELRKWPLESWSNAWVMEACSLAEQHGKRNLSYVRGILQRVEREGGFTKSQNISRGYGQEPFGDAYEVLN